MIPTTASVVKNINGLEMKRQTKTVIQNIKMRKEMIRGHQSKKNQQWCCIIDEKVF